MRGTASRTGHIFNWQSFHMAPQTIQGVDWQWNNYFTTSRILTHYDQSNVSPPLKCNFNLISQCLYIFIELSLRGVPYGLTDDRSSLVQIMAPSTWTNHDTDIWCHMASPGHHESEWRGDLRYGLSYPFSVVIYVLIKCRMAGVWIV